MRETRSTARCKVWHACKLNTCRHIKLYSTMTHTFVRNCPTNLNEYLEDGDMVMRVEEGVKDETRTPLEGGS